jgi:hypothetical protein
MRLEAVTRVVGNGNLEEVTAYALANLLFSSAQVQTLLHRRLEPCYEGASRQLWQAIRNLGDEADRQALPVTPVELASRAAVQLFSDVARVAPGAVS